jgi:threonine dehydrogenase-like Zn-dependent dehydrogenase
LARELGADYIVNPEDPTTIDQIRQICGRKLGVDFSVVCAIYPLYQRLAVEAVRHFGKVHFLHFLGRRAEAKEQLILNLSRDVMGRHIEYDSS